jgi:hypothetical protein
MTALEMLKTNLQSHIERRAQLAEGEGVRFIKRSGYSVEAVIASYDKIISELQAEISELQNKKAARKQPQAKKTPTKNASKKKPQSKKKAKAAK